MAVKRHISSLTNKGYKTSEVEAVKENAEKKSPGVVFHTIGFVSLRTKAREVQREGSSHIQSQPPLLFNKIIILRGNAY